MLKNYRTAHLAADFHVPRDLCSTHTPQSPVHLGACALATKKIINGRKSETAGSLLRQREPLVILLNGALEIPGDFAGRVRDVGYFPPDRAKGGDRCRPEIDVILATITVHAGVLILKIIQVGRVVGERAIFPVRHDETPFMKNYLK
jgi:hypothetical protein